MSADRKQTRTSCPSGALLPTWDGPEYVRVSPGRYDAVVTRIQGPEWVRRYQRWSLMVEFELLSESKRVCAFFNMGANPVRPHAGPQSRYYRAWAVANGERPHQRQKLDPSVFLDGQVFKVEVSDSQAGADGQQKDDALVYSRVAVVIAATLRDQPKYTVRQSTQSSNQHNQVIKNQESCNHAITNQPIKGATGHAKGIRLSQAMAMLTPSKPEGREFRLPLRPQLSQIPK